jgi:hypothetical protein
MIPCELRIKYSARWRYPTVESFNQRLAATAALCALRLPLHVTPPHLLRLPNPPPCPARTQLHRTLSATCPSSPS